ncbi:MAG: sigma-54-dependent Fis family transcriptional regulator [Candidatus Marinimicrobia bacterium]|jgi:DNA-binding NtrC family response regulator|nr:sigma-54-dependent Fis family transcriptional regulator [Candidatus Neomarinimicrobiota bacterium]MBT4361664.1 sigma-54-dependent Fis family transcriptional regulator [Candidatus Neomarinimicrobiota bacterium]MBT4713972.1 sigma-54-dependent Fis family transcriptional regulator [Candidatus Neomarinimicrobiota bacterium]MBT4947072.1 sigma-54-dependent Fis family transcriptional regulator [Candidatus Neomarinimicrobiota bacterium]MBT5268430.1 sigma-54-dependent Fis family transcriptional regula
MDTKHLKILIADDESVAREGLVRALQNSYQTIEAVDGRDAWEKIQSEKPDIVLLDLSMPKLTGIEVLELLKKNEDSPLVIMITAHGSERSAVEAMKAGAYDYVTKPYKLTELRKILDHATEKIFLELDNKRLRETLAEDSDTMVGQSSSMRLLKKTVQKVAESEVTVHLTGESGTGKELVAQNIHDQSERHDGPFIAVNCAALPRELIESELFGFKKGAFSGANKDTPGKFQLANNGTLFLDEIGDMDKGCQAKVLRALEEGEVTPLGSTSNVPCNARIITATNQDLHQLVTSGEFREDLFYRICVVEVSIPPLRDRRSDILPLAEHFFKKYLTANNKYDLDITPEVCEILMNHSWPGNVRELRNVMESLVVLSGDKMDHVQLENQLLRRDSNSVGYSLNGRDFKEAKQAYTNDLETSLISEALRRKNGNISRAAEYLGMQRQFLQQKIKQLGMDARKFIR